MQRRSFLGTLGSLAAPAIAAPPPAGTDAKRLIVHADDAGMCHSVNLATIDAMTKGLVSSASVMLPCPWVQEFADWAKAHPEKDLGIHCTLTSEWKYYRWRPVASIDKVKGLIDKEGYTWRDVRSAAMNASAAEIETELRAQIQRAREYGIQFTHLDSHMGTLFARPDYFDVYTRLSKEFSVPCMLPRPTPDAEAELKGYPITPDMLKAKEAAGYRMLDRLVTGVPGRTPAERRESYRQFIAGLKPGVTKLIIHLAKDDAEIRAVTGSWEYRWADFLFWTSDEARDLLAANNVQLFTYRQLAA
ncbi:MAG: polysaccharide deacetylase family protein [Acidobacteria bacterium]|nr:polysaccharide deacetylase family protein [Acidobacteriota bacterium]